MEREGILAVDVESIPIRWLWEERIPRGMVSVVAGKPDQGKGLISTYIASEVTRQGENCLIAAHEDDHRMMTKPRLEAAEADLRRCYLWRFKLPSQFDELADKVEEHDISLVILDPFAASLDSGVSRFTDGIRKVTQPLSELCEATDLSVIIIEHALKRATAASGDPLTAIGGTGSGLAAAARMAYLFGRDPKDSDRRLLCPVKSNLRERPKALAFEVDVQYQRVGTVPYLIGQGETDIDASALLQKGGDGTPGRPADKRAAASQWLGNLLYDYGKPMKAKLVYEDARHQGNLAQRTLQRSAKDMKIIKVPDHGGPECTWQLPPVTIKAMKVERANEAKHAAEEKAAKAKAKRAKGARK